MATNDILKPENPHILFCAQEKKTVFHKMNDTSNFQEWHGNSIGFYGRVWFAGLSGFEILVFLLNPKEMARIS